MKRRFLILLLVFSLLLADCSGIGQSGETRLETKTEETAEDLKEQEMTKEDAEKALSELLVSLKDVSSEENLNKMSDDKEAWKNIIPKNLHNKIYYFDTFSGPEYENLAWQTLMSITIVHSKETEKVDDETRKVAIESIPLDKERSHTIVPLGLYGKNLIGYYVDMVYDKSTEEWKVMTYNLSNQMMLVDFILQSTQEAAKE